MPAPTFEEKLVDTFQATSVALVQYEKMAAEKTAKEAQVQTIIPTVVDELVRYGRIEPAQKEAAVRALGDHADAPS